jgi:Flp pilus assembly protein TadD
MYQMWYGIALYEKAVKQGARRPGAQREQEAEEIKPDLSVVNFDKAQQHLAEAVKLNGDMWRAHYYLGRIYREQGQAEGGRHRVLQGAAGRPARARVPTSRSASSTASGTTPTKRSR